MNTQQAGELKARVTSLEEEVARLRVFFQVAIGRLESRLDGTQKQPDKAERPILTRPKLS